MFYVNDVLNSERIEERNGFTTTCFFYVEEVLRSLCVERHSGKKY